MTNIPENKNDNPTSIIIYTRIYQTIFLFLSFSILYCIITLNYTWILIYSSIAFAQSYYSGRNQTYINLIANTLKLNKFFNIKRYYQEKIPTQQKTLFAFQPHSIFSYCILSLYIGVVANLNHPDYPNQKLSKIYALSSRFMLAFPIIGLLLKFWGFYPVNAHNLKKYMKQGKDIGLVPGGFEEATYTSTKSVTFFLKKRKGFIKYALKYGYTVRPVIVMNQHKAFWTLESGLNYRLILNKFKIPGVLFCSRYGMYLPSDLQMDTIIGKGLHPQRKYEISEQPTLQEIDRMHTKYLQIVQQLYEKHKDKNGGVPLKIV